MSSALARSLRAVPAVDPEATNGLASLRAQRSDRGALPKVDLQLTGQHLVGHA